MTLFSLPPAEEKGVEVDNVSALEKKCATVLVYPNMCTILILSPFQVNAQENAESLFG